jgi:hypothetical protein
MPNEAMFRAAITAGSNIGMVATFAPAVATMEEEFREFAAEIGSPARLRTIVAEGAIEKLRQGNAAEHDARVADAALGLAVCDAIMLAHFSTARAAGPVGERVTCAVLTAPDSAVTRMKQFIDGHEH